MEQEDKNSYLKQGVFKTIMRNIKKTNLFPTNDLCSVNAIISR
jgi:hypothetical protein